MVQANRAVTRSSVRRARPARAPAARRDRRGTALPRRGPRSAGLSTLRTPPMALEVDPPDTIKSRGNREGRRTLGAADPRPCAERVGQAAARSRAMPTAEDDEGGETPGAVAVPADKAQPPSMLLTGRRQGRAGRGVAIDQPLWIRSQWFFNESETWRRNTGSQATVGAARTELPTPTAMEPRSLDPRFGARSPGADASTRRNGPCFPGLVIDCEWSCQHRRAGVRDRAVRGHDPGRPVRVRRQIAGPAGRGADAHRGPARRRAAVLADGIGRCVAALDRPRSAEPYAPS